MISLKFPGYRVHQAISVAAKVIMLIGLCLALYQGRFQVAMEITLILCISFLPLVLKRRYSLRIPHEFELLAIVFLFAALFLGEVHDYYLRYWWWDLVLHAGAGLLLGIVGFLLVYVLNADQDIELNLHPGFMGLFAFAFSMAFAAVWEIFEFSMDGLFGLTMQKPMLNDPSGLTDTMWDLIVDGAGAAVIAVVGYGYLRTTDTDSFLEAWIDDFIAKNPGLFRDD